MYIKKHSDHPPNIINEVHKAISKRLTSIYCNKDVFDRNIGIYNTTLMNKMNQQVIALKKKVTKRGNAIEILYGTTHHTL